MKNVVIVDSVRTGLAKSFRGTLNMTRGDDMVAHCIDALLDRNPNLPADAVEDIIMGCGNPEGPTGHNIGRNAVVLSKLPLTTSGTTEIDIVHQDYKQFLWPLVRSWQEVTILLWQVVLNKSAKYNLL